MTRKKTKKQSINLHNITQRWILQILIELGDEKFLEHRHFKQSQIMRHAIPKLLPNETLDEELTIEDVMPALQVAYNKLPTANNLYNEYPKSLRDNLDKLSTLVGLSETEWHILGLAILLESDLILSAVTDTIENISSTTDIVRLLSLLLNTSTESVREATKPNSLLAMSGLLTIEQNRRNNPDFSDFFNVLSNDFANEICQDDITMADLLRGVIETPPPAQLSRANFTHIESQLSLLIPYLNSALKSNKKGVNIFVYGAPGTGKTQLSRLLASLTDSECIEVSCQDDNGEAANEHERLRAFSAAQKCFARQRTLLVFDEVEEIFSDGLPSRFASKSVKNKSWLNRNLENNEIPTIWLSNDVSILDDAFIRRFDMVFELPTPPKKQRQTIIEQLPTEPLEQQFIDRLADNANLTPAIISRAANVVQMAQYASSQQDLLNGSAQHSTEKQITMLVNQTLQAQGKPIIKKQATTASIYSPEYINTERDMSELMTGIQHAPSARMCFYGSPGTGKTAYAKYLAEQLDKTLVSKKASDLLSPYVGMAEKQIASAFREAECEEAILLIDEADSFLRDRSQAQRSWEVSQVNEMLTQIEAFSGIFIATTNLMDGIDEAAMRRFDMKLCFHYLTQTQSQLLLGDYANLLGLKSPTKRIKAKIAELTTVTTGDFAAVGRRHRFAPFDSIGEFVSALAEECQFKSDDNKMPIGFCH